MSRPSADTSHRPALDNLHDQHKEAVERLYDGFSSYWEVVGWSHDVVILSAGGIERDLLRSTACLYGERPIQEAILSWSDRPAGESRQVRHQMAVQYVVPAFRRAVREVRFDATEYGENPPDATKAEHVAFRPAWEELREKQRDVLKEWWGGFEDLEALVEWSQRLSRAVLGEENREFVEALTGGLDLMCRVAVTASEYAEENPMLCQRVRAGVASVRLLPWMADAVRKQVSRASEQTVEERPEVPEYELGDDLEPEEL